MAASSEGMRSGRHSVSARDWVRRFSYSASGANRLKGSFDVRLVGGDVVGSQEDGATGEPGFQSVVETLAFPSGEVGPGDNCAFSRLAASCLSDAIRFQDKGVLSSVLRMEGP
jgi:hypothetical protein